MNKRLLIALTTILVIIALMFAFVACNKEGSDDVVPTPDSDELTETAFFTAVNEVTSPSFDIMILDSEDSLVYSRDANGVEAYAIKEFEGLGDFAEQAGGSINYDAEMFSTTSISGKKFTGDVRNPLAFWGIEDDSVSIPNTKVTIEVNIETKNDKESIVLKQLTIASNATIDGIEFKITIKVTP